MECVLSVSSVQPINFLFKIKATLYHITPVVNSLLLMLTMMYGPKEIAPSHTLVDGGTVRVILRKFLLCFHIISVYQFVLK